MAHKIKCPDCKGEGEINVGYIVSRADEPEQEIRELCVTCNGTGWKRKNKK